MAMAGFSLRREAAGVRGRERVSYLDGSAALPGSERTKSLRQGAQEPRQEHHPHSLDGPLGDGRVDGHQGATDSEVYVEHFLAPTLYEGQVVVLDGLGAHRPKRIRELIEARGAELVFLASYSPDLNPIEEAFSKIKNALRKVGARLHEALVEAMSGVLREVAPWDAAGWFDHCGYEVEVQYL